MRLALALALLAAPAHAACQGDEALSCTIGRKALEVCYWQGALIYAYGRDGKPELTLSEPLETVSFTPWPGIGRAIWDTVAFENDGITYEVRTSFDKMDDTAGLEGGVTEMQVYATLATLVFDKGGVAQSLDSVSDLKAGSGQCWDYESKAWGRCN